MKTDKEKTTAEAEHSTIPDGGYGWIITAASFMCHFIADGIAYSFGLMLTELVETFGSSKSATSWIASLFVGIPLIGGPVAGLFVTKYGCRATTILGALITSIGMLLSSFASSLEMLTITYGVIAGFGLAFIYVPASVIPSFWFEKKRSLVTGIAVSGSGLGTFAIAPLVEFLLDEYGWRGTMLVMSGITLNFLVFGALFREVSQASSTVVPLNQKQVSVDSLPSIVSIKSLTELPDNDNSCSTSTVSSFGTPIRKHHSTNTVWVGEQFELLRELSTTQERCNLKNRSSAAQLLLSRQHLLPVSRHDITSVMTLAMRKRTFSSCPDLSVSDEGNAVEEHDNDEEDQSRVVLKRTSRKTLRVKTRHLLTEMCDVRLFTVPVYLLFFISNFMLSYAYDLPYIYMPDYAITNNIGRPSFLIAIIGIASTFGQILFGYLGDRKCLDILLLYGGSIALCGISVTLVPVLHDFASLAAFSVVFGFLLSANFSLETVVLVKILSLEQLTKAYGLLMFGQGMASLIGPPIGGILIDITGEYLYTFLFTGLSIIISGVLATAIFFVRKCSHTRAVSECAEVVPAHNSALSA